ncbi:calmodulin-binding transcription activator 2-like, partial [Malurus melanocephalus]|uniref:calmodulin-binding transcription activator 2-like n=1 Tax=Malurus melanocephalus TaxID=175006 RepID=UPI002547409A
NPPCPLLTHPIVPTGTPGHKCGSTKHRIISPKVERGGGGSTPGDPPKPAPSSPDTTQPSPGLGVGAAPPEGPRAPPFPPAGGLPLLVVANLGGGAAPGGPEQPLGLTPSQHLVTPEGTCPTAPPPAAAFDPDCFLNSPRRGQTYGCEAEAPPGAPPPPPTAPPKPGGDEEEEEEEGKQGTVSQDPLCELSAAPPPQHPFPLPFPELLAGDTGVPPNSREPPHTPHLPSSPPDPPSDPPVAITDFSPEWSYPEGGVKVLITGPWGDPGVYSCLFDRTSVPAALVQPGVLRCYCPPHEAGVAALRVACPPRLLSAAAPFEYRARGAARGPPGAQLDWLALDEAQFRLSILERLEQLEARLGALPPPAPLPPLRGTPSETPPEQVRAPPLPTPRTVSPVSPGLSTASSLSSPSGLSEGPGSVPLPPSLPGPSEDENWGVAVPPSSPEDAPPSDTLQAEVVTLARQIIEATPERIKQEAPGGPLGTLGALAAAGGTLGTPGPAGPAGFGAAMAWLATYLESVDRPPAAPQRYSRGWGAVRGTPKSLGGSAQSCSTPGCFWGFSHWEGPPTGTPGVGGLSGAPPNRWEGQPHPAFEGAMILGSQSDTPLSPQFALFQRMTQAAILIQSKFRSYAEQKRFQRRRRAAVLIQQRFRSLRQHRSTFLTLKQDQAARKIMRFLRRCRHRMEELKQNKEVDSLQTRGLAS